MPPQLEVCPRLTKTYTFADQFNEAVKYANLTVQANLSFSVAHAFLVASQVGLGDMPAAQRAASRLLEVAPMFTVAAFVQIGNYREFLMEGLAAALRKAGLPEKAVVE